MAIAPDCVTPDWPPLSHVASAGALVEKPASTSTVVGSPSKLGSDGSLGSRWSSFTLKLRKQLLSAGSADWLGGSTMAVDGVKTNSFGELPPAGRLSLEENTFGLESREHIVSWPTLERKT